MPVVLATAGYSGWLGSLVWLTSLSIQETSPEESFNKRLEAENVIELDHSSYRYNHKGVTLESFVIDRLRDNIFISLGILAVFPFSISTQCRHVEMLVGKSCLFYKVH
jgi:hypothetical protein